LLPLVIEEGTAALPHAIAVSYSTTPQTFQCYFEKYQRGQGKT